MTSKASLSLHSLFFVPPAPINSTQARPPPVPSTSPKAQSPFSAQDHFPSREPFPLVLCLPSSCSFSQPPCKYAPSSQAFCDHTASGNFTAIFASLFLSLSLFLCFRISLSTSNSTPDSAWLEKCHLVTESCLTVCDPMDCSPPGSSIHGI